MDKNNIENKEINHNLIAITKGAGFFGFGRIVGKGLNFVITLVLVRFLGISVFGLYSLGLIIFNIFSLIAKLGLDNGSLKYVSAYQSDKDKERTKGVIIQSIILPLISGLIIGIIVYVFSPQIAQIFQKEGLIPIIKIFAIGIPFSALLPVLGEINKGFKINKHQILATNVVKPLTRLGLIFLVILLGYNVLGIVWTEIIAIISGVLFLFFSIKKLFPEIALKEVIPKFETKKLLSTSIVLLTIGMTSFLIQWTDILMVGYFLPSESVGIYKVIIQITILVEFSISAFNSIFAPTISSLYHQKKKKQLEKLFKTITRWGFYLGFLVFLIILSSSNELLQLFGKIFSAGKNSLLVLSFGQLINVLVGATGYMLIMTGQEKIESINAACVLILNIILNLILIPKFGILGVAIASAVSLSIINIVRIIEIHSSLKIHPFDFRFSKGLGAGIISLSLALPLKTYFLLESHYLVNLILSSLFTLITFLILLFLFKFGKEDKFILKKIKQKILL